MSLDIGRFTLLLLGTALTAIAGLHRTSSTWERVMLLGLVGGLFYYSGVGSAYENMPDYYILLYFGFLIALVLSFRYFVRLFRGWGHRAERSLSSLLVHIDDGKVWRLFPWAYVLLYLVPLVYPELRLHELLSPAAPDLTTVFAAHWVQSDQNVVMRLVDYAILIGMPFFYLSLYRYRDRVPTQLVLLGSILYFQYVENSYIGRWNVLISLAIVLLSAWVHRVNRRRCVLLLTLVLLPVILAGSMFYQVTRIGGTASGLSFWDAAADMVAEETYLPVLTGLPLVESGRHADLASYFTWLVTLPVPKLLFGEVEGARINRDISEIILGRPRGSTGYYIVLPGLVAEAVYIYGRSFFWIHALFVSALAAFVVRMLERTPAALFLSAYLSLEFAVTLNRAGFAAAVPPVVNGLLVFIVVVWIHSLMQSRRSTHRTTWRA